MTLTLNGFLLLLLIAGHTELLVTFVNRIHGVPLSPRTLRHIRSVHHAMVPGFAILLVWRVGLESPGVLIGGRWSDLTRGWQVWCGISAIGFAGLVASALRWQLRPIPVNLVDQSAVLIDVARHIGHAPIGDGPHRRMIHFPGNQQLSLEVTRKTFRFDARTRLPFANGSRAAGVVAEFSILHVSDLHFTGVLQREFYDVVFDLAARQQCDIAVFTGDLIDEPSLLEWIPATIGRVKAPHGRFFVLGNHDWCCGDDKIRQALAEAGWINPDGVCQRIVIAGVRIELSGDERPWIGTEPVISSDDTAFRILLSHTPDNLALAMSNRVPLMLSGHNHGGQVVLPVIGPVYSPSIHGVRYASGDFLCGDTTLHVSRGVAGRYPLRWNCRPELTRLVVQFVDTE